MKLSDFDFHLPQDRIAAYPPKDRPSAKLLKVDRYSGGTSHHIFKDIGQFLKAGDLIVLNNTKVIPARLFGTKSTGGRVEALLLKKLDGERWETLLRPGGRLKKDAVVTFGDNGMRLEGRVLDDAHSDSGIRVVEFRDPETMAKLEKIGHIPLPPYIDRPDSEIDRELYQTVFASQEGAVASPTAGLHFDEPLLQSLRGQGIETAFVTLHVSYGTFQPVATEDLRQHQMFEEEFEVLPEAAAQINRALSQGRRVIACGTTCVRTLESAAEKQSDGTVRIRPGRSRTRLFIYPPYEFKAVHGMITNFHLPKSSLILLVASLMGRENLLKVYEEAIHKGYRFYSYGDAMLVL